MRASATCNKYIEKAEKALRGGNDKKHSGAHENFSENADGMTTAQTRLIWGAVLGLALGPAMSNGFGRFAYGLVLPAMRDDLGWSFTQAGWIGTANAIGYLVGALLTLRIIDRFSPGRLYTIGMVIVVLSLFFAGLTHDFFWLSIWRLAAGIAGALVFIAGGTLVSTLFHDNRSRNALAIAIYFGGVGFGMFLSGIAIPLLLEKLGQAAWPETWLLHGAVSALALVPSLWAVKFATNMQQQEDTALSLPDESLPIRKMSAELVGYFLFGLGYIVYLTFLIAWMKDSGASALQVALTWGTIGVSVMVSSFIWRPLLTNFNNGTPLAISVAATALGTFIPFVIPGWFGMLLSAAVFGMGFLTAPSAVTSFSRQNLHKTLWGQAVAMYTTVFAVGQMIGPVAAGAIADQTSRITDGLLSAGMLLTVAAVLCLMQRPLTPAKQNP